MRYLSIPRLELESAMLAIDLMNTAKQAYPELEQKHAWFWLDSKVALGWLNLSTKIIGRVLRH